MRNLFFLVSGLGGLYVLFSLVFLLLTGKFDQAIRYEITVKCISLKDNSVTLDKTYLGQYEAKAA